MKNGTNYLTARYAALMALYWAAFCAVMSFFVTFLLWLGFSSTSAGLVVALGNVGGVALQPLAAGWAARRRHGVHRMAVGLAAALMALGLVLVPARRLPLAAAALMVAMCAVLYALQGIVNALGMGYENAGLRCNFGLARGVGSAGYAAASFALGALTARFTPGALPWAYAAIFLTTLLLVLALPRAEAPGWQPAAPRGGTAAFLRRYPRYTAVLAASVLLFLCYNLFTTYMIQIVRGLGGDTGAMGVVLGLGALVELPAMALVGRLRGRFSAGGMMLFSSVFLTIKALLIAFAPSVAFIYLAQAVQPLSYALIIPASVYYTNEALAPADRVLGQALMVTTSSLASVFAGLLGGPLIDRLGLRAMMLTAVALSVCGAALLAVATRGRKRA